MTWPSTSTFPQGEALVRAILAAATKGNPLERFINTSDESDRLVFVTGSPSTSHKP